MFVWENNAFFTASVWIQNFLRQMFIPADFRHGCIGHVSRQMRHEKSSEIFRHRGHAVDRRFANLAHFSSQISFSAWQRSQIWQTHGGFSSQNTWLTQHGIQIHQTNNQRRLCHKVNRSCRDDQNRPNQQWHPMSLALMDQWIRSVWVTTNWKSKSVSVCAVEAWWYIGVIESPLSII